MRIRGWAAGVAAVLALAAAGCGAAAEDGTADAVGGDAPVAAPAAVEFDDLDMCGLSEAAEREAVLGEPAAATEAKDGVLSRGCQATGASDKSYLVYLLTDTPVPAAEYFNDLRAETKGAGVRDLAGVGEKAFADVRDGEVSVHTLTGDYVLVTSLMYFQDSDRPADTGPVVTRLTVLTGQIIDRI